MLTILLVVFCAVPLVLLLADLALGNNRHSEHLSVEAKRQQQRQVPSGASRLTS